MSKKSSNNLHDADTAVADFLDILLQEATEPPAIPPPAEPPRVLLMPDIELTPVSSPKTAEAESKPSSSVDVVTPVVESIIEREEVETSDQPGYQFPLQCLVFNVGENRLSIPLIDLGSVLPWKDRLTRLPDAPDWFLGILQHRDVNVKVVETAKILRIPTLAGESGDRHLLVFGDENWAISCDKLGEVLHLEHDDVQWSATDSGGLTLGTIRESLAVLLDPKKILRYLRHL